MSSYAVEVRGMPQTESYRLFFKKDGQYVSPMHDIPLESFNSEMSNGHGTRIFNMVVEVPRWTNAKMEISLTETMNPIKQDVKKGKLRYVANCFPHKGYIWNYGCLPQTWEDPDHVDTDTKCRGDGDPVDVCEIGHRVRRRGEVVQVKVLGTLAMIDEGETDWKLLAIDINDPLAPKLNCIADIEREMPGFLAATVEWFTIYKMPDGKPANKFAFDGKPQDVDVALRIIDETHTQWRQMITNKTDTPSNKMSRIASAFADAAEYATDGDSIAQQIQSAHDAAEAGHKAVDVDSAVDKWHFVSLD